MAGLTTMIANDSLVGTECATRTSTPPISGNFTQVPILGEYVEGGDTPITFYELTNLVNIGGVQFNDHYWVASTEVTVAP